MEEEVIVHSLQMLCIAVAKTHTSSGILVQPMPNEGTPVPMF